MVCWMVASNCIWRVNHFIISYKLMSNMSLDAIAPEEIVDGFMVPAEMTLEQKRQADQQ